MIRPIWPEGQGEKLLLAAVVRRAAYDIALYRGHKKLKFRRLWIDAYHWMFNELSSRELFSFLSICEVLDQDPDTIRRKTLKLTRKDVKKYDMVGSHVRV